MNVQYNGIHSINIYQDNGHVAKNTWKDFHLIPSARPYIEIPEPVIKIIKIPGTNKRIDITDYLSNSLLFEKVIGDWEFIIVHDSWKNWVESYNALVSYLNGVEAIVSLTDDPEKYYSGILTISNYKPEEEYSTITIHYELSSQILTNPQGLYPIKFILPNGQSYIEDYGIERRSEYMEGNIMVLYDLFVLNRP